MEEHTPKQLPNKLPNPSVSSIEAGLYLGDQSSSYLASLGKHNITAMISLSDAKSLLWGSAPSRGKVPQNRHMFIACLDTTIQDLALHFAGACDFIDQNLHGLTKSNNVLVHCMAGVLRSATIVIAYLMRKYRQSLDEALASVQTKRRLKLNANFMEQLALWADTNYDICEDKDGRISKEPYAAYLARRANRLAEKGLTGDEPTYPDL